MALNEVTEQTNTPSCTGIDAWGQVSARNVAYILQINKIGFDAPNMGLRLDFLLLTPYFVPAIDSYISSEQTKYRWLLWVAWW